MRRTPATLHAQSDRPDPLRPPGSRGCRGARRRTAGQPDHRGLQRRRTDGLGRGRSDRSRPTCFASPRCGAELMKCRQPAGDGLVSVRGIDEARISELAMRHGAALAIINPGGFILGGSADASRCSADAVSAGASRVTRLPVAVASHTPRLAEAARQFRSHLAATTIDASALRSYRLVSGIDGGAVFDV